MQRPDRSRAAVIVAVIHRANRRFLRVPLASLAALPLLLLGQALTRDRVQDTNATTAPPPAIRARFEAIRRQLRPKDTPLPVAIQQAPIPRADWSDSTDAKRVRRPVWVADWPSADGGTGLRVILDGRTGEVLVVGGEAGPGMAVEGERDGPVAAIRTGEAAARTARRYLRWLVGREANSAAVSLPLTLFRVRHYLVTPTNSRDVWRLQSRGGAEGGRGGGARSWMMLLDARTGALLQFWIAPPRD